MHSLRMILPSGRPGIAPMRGEELWLGAAAMSVRTGSYAMLTATGLGATEII